MTEKKKRGLAAASAEIRRMVGQKGGRAFHRSRGPQPGRQRRKRTQAEE